MNYFLFHNFHFHITNILYSKTQNLSKHKNIQYEQKNTQCGPVYNQKKIHFDINP